MKLEFITRDDCPLCDEASAILSRLSKRLRLEIEELDVDSDEELLRIYDERVPILRSKDGTVLASGKWTRPGLVATLLRHRLKGSRA